MGGTHKKKITLEVVPSIHDSHGHDSRVESTSRPMMALQGHIAVAIGLFAVEGSTPTVSPTELRFYNNRTTVERRLYTWIQAAGAYPGMLYSFTH